jgi:hypothetical protein
MREIKEVKYGAKQRNSIILLQPFVSIRLTAASKLKQKNTHKDNDNGIEKTTQRQCYTHLL